MEKSNTQQEYYNVITDIWKALKVRADIPEDSDQFWDDSVKAFNAIAEKYKGTDAAFLAWRMALAALAALEDQHCKQREATNG